MPWYYITARELLPSLLVMRNSLTTLLYALPTSLLLLLHPQGKAEEWKRSWGLKPNMLRAWNNQQAFCAAAAAHTPTCRARLRSGSGPGA
jgi:hypothetical protein